MGDRLELAVFVPCVGDRFRLEFDAVPPVDLTLVDASPGRWQPAAESGLPAAFRLEFEGPPDPLLPQRTYRMDHETLGRLEIFIVPIARSDKVTTYEAIFS